MTPNVDTSAVQYGEALTLLFIVNAPSFFLSHRLPLAIAARNAGFTVHIATGPGPDCNQIEALGFSHHLLPISRSGLNPVTELVSLWVFYKLMRKVKPTLVHLVTIKPVLYGGLAARLAGVPAMVAAISGLGTLFIASSPVHSLMRRGVKLLYRLVLGHSNSKVIFQNPDDRTVLIGMDAVRDEQTVLIKGSGVSLVEYSACAEPEGVPVVSFAARLLRDKGVREFVGAAQLLKERGVLARFWLIGSPDTDNPTSISVGDVQKWRQDGLVEILGYRRDIFSLFTKTNIVVLPSYREGLPKVLIEAAACGRAVVTTDVPGCRDAIIPEKTGLLVPVRDIVALADAIQLLIENPAYRRQMGIAGRALAEREFDIEKVVNTHLAIYQELLAKINDNKRPVTY